MSKKAKEVVEAEPKFAQPWQGILVAGTVIMIAYVALQWFFNPVTGFLSKMVQANAFVLYNFFGSYTNANGFSLSSLGVIFALNNAQEMLLYPYGYIVNWVSYFILCIVWFITIAVLARPFTPSKSRIGKQPWAGLIVLILSMVLAFIMWYILAFVLKWQCYDIILLGTIGFAVFPIWATLFMYWPFIPRRPQTHAIIRGAVFTVIAWVITFLIRYIALARMQTGSPVTVYSQQYASSFSANALYLYTVPLTTITPTEPFDFVLSLFFAFIVGNTIMAIVAPFPNMKQPARGLLNWFLAIVIGFIIWGILAESPLAQTVTGVLVSYPSYVPGIPYAVLLPVPVVEHANITAALAFPLAILLFGQLTFAMWPWSKWGIKGSVGFVILAFILGAIIYYIMMVNPGFAPSIMGTNAIPSASGLQAIYLNVWWAAMLNLATPGVAMLLMYNYMILAIAFEGISTSVGNTMMFSWTVTILIFWLLAYEGFDHWPFK